jgi:ferredoxin-NADP reductase
LDRLALGAAVQRAPGRWQIATVSSVRTETPRVRSFVLQLPMWMPHMPGQHYDVRLTAPDGYHAQRSYSVASSPLDEGEIELTIDRLDEGEVSGYFHDVVVEGDQVEVRGPFASYFVWRGESPALLIGGGSGVVPLMAMMRHRRRLNQAPQQRRGSATPHMPELEMTLVYSVRRPEEVIYADELDGDVLVTFTREAPEGWSGHTGRIDAGLIAAAAARSRAVFICGSNGFVEAASALALEAGADPGAILTERFGPTG